MTLYEVGKLGHANIAELCKDLSSLEGTKFEGELQEFANHASSLRCILECLLSGGIETDAKSEEVFIHTDEVAPISDPVGANEGEVNSDDNCLTEVSETRDGESLIPIEGSDIGKETLRRIKKYHVDLLRCESLASLAPATLERLLLRDYDIVVSMVPLPQSSILPGPTFPIHFGPPSYSSMTPWMKLVLYTTVACGPLSVVLMKGQCLRLLPAPLAGCEKALIWSWDGSTVGGLGGKFEGNLVKGGILLHCLNALLKHSAVLVQPLSKYDLDNAGRIVTLDIPLPLKNLDGSTADIDKEIGLTEEERSKLNPLLAALANDVELWTVGYIRLLKLFKGRETTDKYEWVPLSVEFGVPLFSPKLCNNICRRVVSSHLLQTDSLHDHQEAMQGLRRRLRDICAEYQATGPAAKLLYQKEKQKEPSRVLMNYASGRWNPLVDPSSPISGATSEHQRLKLANRQRCHTEVLSFDGSILRYSLSHTHHYITISFDRRARAC